MQTAVVVKDKRVKQVPARSWSWTAVPYQTLGRGVIRSRVGFSNEGEQLPRSSPGAAVVAAVKGELEIWGRGELALARRTAAVDQLLVRCARVW